MLFGKRNEKEKMALIKNKIKNISAEIAEIWNSKKDTKQFDADGWYTGNPQNSSAPEQDADDL